MIKLKALSTSQFLLTMSISSFILDVFNFIFFQQIGLDILLDSTTFTHTLKEKALQEGVLLTPALHQEIRTLFYNTLLFICFVLVFINCFFYIASLKKKRWAIDYVHSMNLLGALLGLTITYEVYQHSLCWALLTVIQTISYTVVFIWAHKRKNEWKIDN